MVNTNIEIFLNNYLKDPNPQYAVLLEGKWGCGKTFFIRNWIEKSSKETDTEELKPLYVSLFGMSSTKEVTEAINHALFPILDNKYFKAFSKFGQVLGKAVLKCDFDVSGTDCSANFDISPLMQLFSDDNTIKGQRFLVFDDLERCHINIKQILGYINQFVENHKFKVVLVCNSNEFEKDDRIIFEKFKEKIVGRTFSLQQDTKAAIAAFVNEKPVQEFTKNHQEAIFYAFGVSGGSNLRILRQTVRDFNDIYSRLKYDTHNEYHNEVILGFLVQFIAIYAELNEKEKDIIENLRAAHIDSLKPNTNENRQDEKKERLKKLEEKYERLNSSYHVNVLDLPSVEAIVKYYAEGEDISSFLNERLQPKDKPEWEKLQLFYELSCEEFEQCYEANVKLLQNLTGSPEYIYPIILTMIDLDDEGVKPLGNDIKELAKDLLQTAIRSCNTAVSLRKVTGLYQNAAHHTYTDNAPRPLLQDFNRYFFDLRKNRQKEMFAETSKLTESLTEENLQKLMEMQSESVPDFSTTYEDYPIFKDANPDKVAKSILNLSNKGKWMFVRFLNSRYHIHIQQNLPDRLMEDVSTLKVVKDALKQKVNTMKEVERYNTKAIVDTIGNIEKKAELSNKLSSLSN